MTSLRSPQPNISQDNTSLDTNLARPGSVTFITNNERDKFIIQQKDNTYRVASYANGYSLFGGGTEPFEFPRDTLNRELREEIKIKEIGKLLKNSKAWDSHQLRGSFRERGQDRTFSFRLFVYESVLSSEWFNKVSHAMLQHDNIDEGKAVLVTAEELQALASSDENDEFIFNIGEVVRAYLEAHRSRP